MPPVVWDKDNKTALRNYLSQTRAMAIRNAVKYIVKSNIITLCSGMQTLLR